MVRAMGKAKQSSAQPVPDIPQLVSLALATLESDGVVKLSTLGPVAVRAQVAAEVAKQGFEVTKSSLRKPAIEQLKQALSDGAFIALKRVGAQVTGATAAEAKRAALALVAGGAAHLVLRGKEEVLVPVGTPVLSRKELLELNAFAKSVIAKAATAKTGLSLLHVDVAEVLARVMPPSAPNTGVRVEKKAVDRLLASVLSAVDATREQQTGLSFVPAIIARLRPSLSSDAAREALLRAANEGLVELRPEGGINRLSAEELSLCLPGPQGTRLSWARRTENNAP
jgi:hypothetical protein